MAAPISQQAVEKVVEQFDNEARFRKLSGWPAAVVTTIAIGLSLFQLYTAGVGPLEALRQRSLHLTIIMVLAFLLYPASGKSNKKVPTIMDWLLSAATVVTVGYLFYNFDAFIHRNGVTLPFEYVLGAIGIILVLEAGRRVLGKELLIMAVIFLLYCYFGKWIPGILGHRGYSPTRIIEHMYFGTEGLFGIALSVSATYMFLFILFGAFLGETGLSSLINDGAMALTGRSPGGPAKVAVIASGFMGMLNGSAVANAASVGAFTIPLMKRAGYRGEFAAGVEGASSTGGQIMPPVMGAAAFLIAEFLGVPYGQIAIAAFIPALFYYGAVWMMVHAEAKRLGLRGLSKEELPNLGQVMKEKGYLLIPVIIMVTLLILDYTPLFAGYWAIISVFLVAWIWEEGRAFLSRKATLQERWYVFLPFVAFLVTYFVTDQDYSLGGFIGLCVALAIALINPKAAPSLQGLKRSLNSGARGAVGVALATAIVGFVVGAASLTSLGLNLGASILKLSGNSLILALFLTMVTSIIVGTGIPTTPTYIIVALVSAPVLVKMGVPPLAAHMFVFYYGALADVTPPTALSAYTAAGIAGVDPQKSTWIAWKLAMVGFIIPYYFVINPGMLLDVGHVTWLQIGTSVLTGVIGTLAMAYGLQGYAIRRAGWVERVLLVGAAIVLIWPGYTPLIAGAAILVAVLLFQKVFKAPEQQLAA